MMDFPNSLELERQIKPHENLYILYRELGKSTPHGNQAERDEVKKQILAIFSELEQLRARPFYCPECGKRTKTQKAGVAHAKECCGIRPINTLTQPLDIGSAK